MAQFTSLAQQGIMIPQSSDEVTLEWLNEVLQPMKWPLVVEFKFTNAGDECSAFSIGQVNYSFLGNTCHSHISFLLPRLFSYHLLTNVMNTKHQRWWH